MVERKVLGFRLGDGPATREDHFATEPERDRSAAEGIEVHAGDTAETPVGHLVRRDEQIGGGHRIAAEPAVETTRVRDEQRQPLARLGPGRDAHRHEQQRQHEMAHGRQRTTRATPTSRTT